VYDMHLLKLKTAFVCFWCPLTIPWLAYTCLKFRLFSPKPW